MKRASSLATSLLTAFVLFACGSSADDKGAFPDGAYATTGDPMTTVELRTAPAQPPVRGDVQLELRVRDGDGRPKNGLTIGVVPFMPSHGHGTHTTPSVEPAGDGTYVVRGCMLTMAGTWQLQLTMKSESGDEHHAVATIDVL